jgi:hypothetical protein
MSGFFKALKNQIKDEVVRMAQPQPQQHNGASQYQYQPHYQPSSYGNSQGQHEQQHAPQPSSYQQYQQAGIPQPQYQGSTPQPNNQVPLPREGQYYGTHPAPMPVPPPVTQFSRVGPPPGPPPVSFQTPVPQPNACTARKNVLTKYNQFYVFKHLVFPREDPKEQDLTFAICEECYKTHVSRQPGFASSFEPFQSPDSISAGAVAIPTSRALCDFWLPAVKDTFYKQCIPQNSIQPLVKVAHDIQKSSTCPGNQVWQGGEVYTSPSIPNCSICPRCYELYVKPTFGSYFVKEQQGTRQWTCDIGKDPGYIYELLISIRNSTSPSFANFAHGAKERLNLTPCTGEGKAVQPSQGNKVIMYCIPNVDLGACSECYYDYLKLTSFSHLFIPTTYDSKAVTVTCDLAIPVSRFILTKALAANNLSIWQSGVENFNKIPKCAYMNGVPEEDVQKQQSELGQLATWYSVIHSPKVEICPSCYHGIVIHLGVLHLFRPITRPLVAGAVRVCNFSIGSGGVASFDPKDFPTTLHWRGFMLRTLLDRLTETPPLNSPQNQDFSSFLSLATILNSAGPPCGAAVRGFKKPSGRRYFGRVAQNKNNANDCTVVMCEECYNDLVKDEPLEKWLGQELTDQVYAGDSAPWKKEFQCQPWSKTSKNVLRKASAAGDFTIFARHWNHRM